jgi:hypothetical protein
MTNEQAKQAALPVVRRMHERLLDVVWWLGDEEDELSEQFRACSEQLGERPVFESPISIQWDEVLERLTINAERQRRLRRWLGDEEWATEQFLRFVQADYKKRQHTESPATML